MNCNYKLNVGGVEIHFSNEYDLEEYVRLNYVKLSNHLLGINEIKYSKSGLITDDVASEVNKALSNKQQPAGKKRGYDSNGFKNVDGSKDVKSFSASKFLNDGSFTINGRQLVNIFNEDSYKNETIGRQLAAKLDPNVQKEILGDRTYAEAFADLKKKFINEYNKDEYEAEVRIFDSVLLRQQRSTEAGNLTHKIAEIYFQQKRNIDDTISFIKDNKELLEEVYSGYDYDSLSELIIDHINGLEASYRAFEDTLPDGVTVDKIYTEYEFNVDVDVRKNEKHGTPYESKDMKCIIDLLIIDSNGVAHILDFKSSAKNISEFSSDKKRKIVYQLALYKKAIESLGIEVGTAGYFPIEVGIDDNLQINSIDYEIDKYPIDITKQLHNYDYATRNIKSLFRFKNQPSVNKKGFVKSKDGTIVNLSIDLDKHYETTTGLDFHKKVTDYEVEKYFKNNDYVIETETGFTVKLNDENLPDIEIKGKSEENIQTAKEELRKVLNNRSTGIPQRTRQIIKAASAMKKNLTGRFFGSTDHDPKNATFNSVFSMLIRQDFKVVDTPEYTELIDEGIIPLRKEVKDKDGNITFIMEFVSIVRLSPDFVFKNENGTSLMSGLIPDAEAKKLGLDKTQNSSKNQLGLKLMSFIDANPELFKDTKLNSMTCLSLNKTMNNKTFVDLQEVHRSFAKMCSIRGAEANKLEFTSSVYNLFSVMQIASNAPMVRDVEPFKDLKRMTNAQKRELLEIIKKQLVSYSKIKKVETIDVNRSSDHADILMYHLSKLYHELTGMQTIDEPDLVELGLKNSTQYDSIGDMDNRAVRNMQSLFESATQNIRSRFHEFTKKTNSIFTDHIKGVSYRFFNAPVKSFYMDLFEKESNGVTVSKEMILKDPEDMDNSLDDNQRSFIRKYLKALNESRAIPLKNTRTIEYRQVPILMGSSTSKLQQKGVKTAVSQWYKDALVHGDFTQEMSDNSRNSKNETDLQEVNDYTAIDSDARRDLIASHDVLDFEMDLELLLRHSEFAKIKAEEMNKVLPGIFAIRVMNKFIKGGSNFEELDKYIDKYTKHLVFNDNSMAENLKPVAQKLSAIKQVVSFINLSINPFVVVRELLQGHFNISIRLMSKSLGKDTPSMIDYAKSIAEVANPEEWQTITTQGKHTKLEQLNHMFGMSAFDLTTMVSNASQAKKHGLFTWLTRGMFANNSYPDYVHRMSLLLSVFRKTGVYDAFVMNEEGLLSYDFRLDKRFDLINTLPAVKTKEYLLQKAEYNNLVKEMNDDILKSNGEFIPEWKDGELPPPLPIPFSQRTITSIKTFGNNVMGHFDHESKIMAQNGFFGMMFTQFRSWVNSRKTKYIGDTRQTAVGTHDFVKDENGNIVYQYTDGNGDIQTTVDVDEALARNGEPIIEWKESINEGIIMSIIGMYHTMKDGGLNALISEFKNSPEKRTNMSILMMDFLLVSIIAAATGFVLGDDEEEFKEKNMTNMLAYAMLKSTRDSVSDLMPWTIVDGIAGGGLFPAYNYVINASGGLVNAITGENNSGLEFLFRNVGFLRPFYPAIEEE